MLVTPEPTGDGLLVRAPDVDPLLVRTPDGAQLCDVRIFSRDLAAAPGSEQAHAWFSKVVGSRSTWTTRRGRPNLRYSRAADRVSFADGYPMLLASEGSLAALNDLVAQGPRPEEGPMTMTRFRPNLVVAGAPAWAEDRWRVLRIGAARFRAVKGCERCVMTTIEPNGGYRVLVGKARCR